MLQNFKPKYKEVTNPMIQFACTATGGADVEVYLSGERIRICVNGESSTWDRKDLAEFIKMVQEVEVNTRPEVK